MGYGDQLLISGWAKANGCEPIPQPEWEGPHGYVERTTPERYYYRDSFRAQRGVLELTPDTVDWARAQVPTGPFVMVEPHIKGIVGADNRDWGWEKWQCLVVLLGGAVVQCGIPSKRSLNSVHRISTPTFSHACAILMLSRCLVATNGGLHHAAAALNKPAVVIWGAYNDPKLLGYDDHVNLYEPDPECLGARQSNAACRAAMDRITPERVAEAVNKVVEERNVLSGLSEAR